MEKTNRTVTLTFSDYIHLQDLLRAARTLGFQPFALVEKLEKEINHAVVVSSCSIPNHILTMNSCARLTDMTSGQSEEYTLVFPGEADQLQGKLSVLSELGIALIGFSAGSTINWESAEGSRTTRIDRVNFQPEAAKAM
jgi:regulator of nucleoside diphosphate kinase